MSYKDTRNNKDSESLAKIAELLNKIKHTEDTNESLEQKRVRVMKMQYSAVIMLIVAITAFVVGLVYMDRVYKTYSIMTSSTVYAGLLKRDESNDTLSDTQQLMDEIENLYETCYVGDIQRDNIDEFVLNALVKAYGDRYASYRNTTQAEQNNEKKDNKQYGIGALLTPEYTEGTTKYSLYVVDVYKDSPAEKAGIQIGDLITAINNEELDILDLNYNKALDELNGDLGTTVNLKVNSSGVITNKDVERDLVNVSTVRYKELTPEIGYIRIRDFQSHTDEEFKEALDYFTNKGIQKFVFDLTNNSGGIEDTVINMLDDLLQSGLIVEEYDSSGNLLKSVEANPETGFTFNSVTLINSNTASAAELFAKCLRDNYTTSIVGTRSYGKSTVCTTFTLSNGGQVTLSTGKYLTASKHDIEGKGIEPDYEVKLDREKQDIYYKLDDSENDLIQKALEILIPF